MDILNGLRTDSFAIAISKIHNLMHMKIDFYFIFYYCDFYQDPDLSHPSIPISSNKYYLVHNQ